MGLIYKLFWAALFTTSTFVFVVLFEYGPFDFAVNAKAEYKSFMTLIGMDEKADKKDAKKPAL